VYKWLPLQTLDDLDQLQSQVGPQFDPKRVSALLKQAMADAVKAVLIEDNYIDKDYRSTYYGFYAKKGQKYSADCVRLHFFDQFVAFEPQSLKLSCTDPRNPELEDHYYGYMVLRPTAIRTIGRTVLSPSIRSGAKSHYIISAYHKTHLLGHRLRVQGFPSMDQHVDIAVCAHVACWAILRHYSEAYSIYREFLTHEITMMAHEFNPGGLIPSKGLEVSNAERVFQEAGTFPVVITRDDVTGASDLAFYRQLCAYIESAFPLFAAMHSNQHAVAVVGYQWRPFSKRATPGLRFAWNEVQSLSIVDDNDLPYVSVPASPQSSARYSAQDIDAFIVALPEKVYYPADAVDVLAQKLFAFGKVLNLPQENDATLRYFITTGSALRRFVRNRDSEFDPQLLRTIMKLPFAQFVWVVEFATDDQWANGRVGARAIVDATASIRESIPLWLFHDSDRALVFDRQQVGDPSAGMHTLQLTTTGHAGFSRMEQNLRSYSP
jgi:hypothetical protein